jgi:DNA-binding FadR family transcriptional regulator
MVDRIRQDGAWQQLRERARSAGRQAVYVEQHRRVIAAIAQREAHAAEQAMREHLEAVRDGLIAIMTDPTGKSHQDPNMLGPPQAELRHGT